MAQRLSRRLVVRSFVEQLVTGTASHAQLVRSLAAYLIETKQTKQLDAYMADIATALSAHGQATAEVTSARPLTPAVTTAIKQLITETTKARTITLEQHIDPNVLGGVQLSFNGRRIDTTVRTQLNQLKSAQLQANEN